MGTYVPQRLFLSLLCMVIFVQHARGLDKCSDYIAFPYIEKRDVNYTKLVSDSPLSDMYIDSGNDWFGEEGYDLAIIPPPAEEDRCGTTFPIWIDDTLPKNGQESIVKACFVDIGDDCSKTFQIRVKDCGHLRIYKLKQTPVFDSAYCVGLTDPNKPASTFTVKPTVDVEVETDKNHYDHFKFHCKFVKSVDNLLYAIHWYVNGGFIHSFPAALWTDQLVHYTALTETILQASGYTSVGFDLACAVKASLGPGFPAGKGILSEKKFVGIKVPEGVIEVYEGEPKDIDLQLTVPLGCRGSDDCRMTVYVIARNTPGDCDPSAFVKTQCGVRINGKTWDQPHKLEIRGKTTDGYTPKKTIMKLYLQTGANVITHPFWSNYTIGSITVQAVKNKPVTTQTHCYAHTDPHMKTYDGRRYEFHQSGTYILYKHDVLETEVQMNLLPCSKGATVTCPCGVAVRAGRTVFRINGCNKIDWDIKFDCKDGKDLIKVLKSGSQYKIYLPTGSYVEVSINPSRHFFNVHLYPSNEDFDKVAGLCGTFTKASDDDFKKRDGSYSSAHANSRDEFDDFSLSWRADVDLFNHNDYRQLKSWAGSIILCTCDFNTNMAQKIHETTTCSTVMNQNVCVFNKNFRPLPSAKKVCAIEKRRKRSAFKPRSDKIKREAEHEERAWTEAEAAEYCEGLFNKSKTVSLCQTLDEMFAIIKANMETCIQDIISIRSTSFARDALEATKSLCMHEVEMNSTLQEEPTTGVPSFYETLFDVTCLNECSGKGTCINGTCSCEEGFGADDCSRDKSVPPDVYGLVGDGHCDIATEDCDDISVIGDYFDEYGQIRCRFVKFTINADNTTTWAETVESKPDVESFSEAICILPTRRDKRAANYAVPGAELASGFQISIANYGDVFSEESVLVVYNSKCQSCSVTGNSVACTFTTKSCTAGGICIDHGESHPNNPCFTCDASAPIRKWVKRNDATCTVTAITKDTPSFQMWIIGAIIGGLLLAGTFIGVVFFFKKHRKSRKVLDTPRGSAFMRDAVPSKKTTD